MGNFGDPGRHGSPIRCWAPTSPARSAMAAKKNPPVPTAPDYPRLAVPGRGTLFTRPSRGLMAAIRRSQKRPPFIPRGMSAETDARAPSILAGKAGAMADSVATCSCPRQTSDYERMFFFFFFSPLQNPAGVA
jgi:hypothetical protein